MGYFSQVHEKLPKDKLGGLFTYTFNAIEPTYFDKNMGIIIENVVFDNRTKLFIHYKLEKAKKRNLPIKGQINKDGYTQKAMES